MQDRSEKYSLFEPMKKARKGKGKGKGGKESKESKSSSSSSSSSSEEESCEEVVFSCGDKPEPEPTTLAPNTTTMAPPNTTTVEPETTTDPPMRMDAEMFMSCGYCIKWKKGRVKKVTALNECILSCDEENEVQCDCQIVPDETFGTFF